MKSLLSTTCLVVFCLAASIARSQNSCAAIARIEVESTGADLSLADLLARNSCPELMRSAARIRLGASPLAGSMRVLEGGEVRSLLQQVILSLPPSRRPAGVHVPERIRVRRAGSRSSCASIEAKIFAEPIAVPNEADCGAADRIADNAALRLTRRHWDPALHSWIYAARCMHGGDCVPFLIRAPRLAQDVAPELDSSKSVRLISDSLPSNAAPELNDRYVLVRPGEKTSVLWDEGGIRLTIPAISMDKGSAGDRVRVRLEPSHRIIRAVVVSAGVLRVE